MPEVYELIPEDENLQIPATKGDLLAMEKGIEEKFATKTELKFEIQVLRDDMNEKFNQVEERFNSLDEKIDKLYNVVDNLAGQVQTYNQERAVETHQLSIITTHSKKVGEKIGIPLEL